eukprot:gb/GEZN01002208.1/.p1 GENE.gb/GEZN01002208.1/~~gb/GEZN01002208.1/.p1  ORF type:complete len:721 (-),score=108.13 gb/GEZN01002208.1/:399-2561(-)
MSYVWAITLSTSFFLIVQHHRRARARHAKLDQPPPAPCDLVQYAPSGDEKTVVVRAVTPQERRPVHSSLSGYASVSPVTIAALFRQAVERHGNEVALRVERKNAAGGFVWEDYTWLQYYQESLSVARALIKLGLGKWQSVGILGFNSPEWLIGNMAAILAGGLSVGIYSTNGAELCQYITEHCGAVVLLVEDNSQLKKCVEFADKVDCLQAVVVWKEQPDPKLKQQLKKTQVLHWSELVAMGGEAKGPYQETLEERMAASSVTDACTLIYTSGTTGRPKAVMLSQDNVTWTAGQLGTVFPDVGKVPEHIISYLPLSHVAAQMLDIYSPLSVATHGGNCTLWFARPDALKGTLKLTLGDCRPTIFFGVPRVWEKLQVAIEEKSKKETSSIKKNLLAWALRVGRKGYEASEFRSSIQFPTVRHFLADKVIFSKVRKALGLDRCRHAITGAAPITRDTLYFFGSLNVPIMETYGMSECTGPQTFGTEGAYKIGSCGRSLPGCEIKLDHVATRDRPGEGEICYRGRHVMLGYMHDEKNSREAIDDQGYLHSGDVARVDQDRFVFITGRIKELIVTAGGENIAPVPIEDKLKQECPLISNCMVVGDHRNYNVILITLKSVLNDATGEWTTTLSEEAKQLSPGVTTTEQAEKDPKWQAYLQGGMDRTNSAAVSRAQRVQKFTILPKDFSIPTGELTPTLKLKRSVVAEKYAFVIENLYSPSGAALD